MRIYRVYAFGYESSEGGCGDDVRHLGYAYR